VTIFLAPEALFWLKMYRNRLRLHEGAALQFNEATLHVELSDFCWFLPRDAMLARYMP